jgi:O-antigen ligase
VPLPVGFLRFLNPFQYRVVMQSSVLLGESSHWHSLSYVTSASFAWWIFLLSLFLFFGLLRAHLANPRNLMVVVGVMMGVALLEAFYGLLQVLIPTLGVLWVDIPSGSGNARGTFINRNHFAGFIEMVWPLGLGLILAKAHLWKIDTVHEKTLSGIKRLKLFLSSDRIGLQLLMSSALLFIFLALLFSKSRAGITGSVIGLVAFALLCHIGGKKLSKLAWGILGLGFAFLFLYGSAIGFDQIIDRFMALEEGAGARTDRWKDTLSMIKSHPFGIGLGNYEHVMPVFNTLGSYGIKSVHAHNDYLQLLAETGWPGFVALVVGFYGFLGKSIWRIHRVGAKMDPVRFYIHVGAVSGLISMAFHSFFDFNLQIPANMLYFVVLIGIAMSGEDEKVGS